MSGLQEEQDHEMKNACEQYLSKTPYYGKVRAFEDKAHVKELCRGPGSSGWKSIRWESKLKLWGTTYMNNIPKLLSSGKWEPVGIRRNWYTYLSQIVSTKCVSKENEIFEMKASKAETINQLNEQERIAALEERRKRDARKETNDKLNSMVASTKQEIARFDELGFNTEVADYAISLSTFGPLGCMSTHGRVLRWFNFKIKHATADAYYQTGSKWMTADELVPYHKISKDYWVSKLNQAAQKGLKEFDEHISSKQKQKQVASTKRKRHDHTHTYKHTNETLYSYSEINTSDAVKQNTHAFTDTTQKWQPTFTGYCATCCGNISFQFPECVCTAAWTPCYSCNVFVARHQPCKLGHKVDYPPSKASWLSDGVKSV
jgi:hypothetical protein